MKARDRKVLAALGLVGLLGGLWFLALAPKRAEVAEIQAKVERAEGRRDAAAQRATAAEQSRASYDRDYATVARLGKAVPPNADVPSLVFQLETAAKRAKVDFRAVTVQDTATALPGAASTTAGINPTPFSFTFEGSYGGLRRLLGAVDGFSALKGSRVIVRGRLLTLDSVRLSAGRDGLPQVKAEVIATAYVAEVPDALPATGTPASATTTSTTASQESK